MTKRMRIKIAHLHYDIERIELPEKCPSCNDPINEDTVSYYYSAELHGRKGQTVNSTIDSAGNHLRGVHCGGEGLDGEGCHEILASSNDYELEFRDSLKTIRDDISEFLEEVAKTPIGPEEKIQAFNKAFAAATDNGASVGEAAQAGYRAEKSL